MEIKRCEKGHFYDAEQCTTCPICASEAAKKPNLELSPDFFENFGNPSVPATQPVGGMDPISATQPAGFSMNFTPSAPPAAEKVGHPGKMEKIVPTTPVSPVSTPKAEPAPGKGVFNPVVGWLVCIEGEDRGADYRIHSQYNYIGRASHMDICIPSDTYISGERAAVLAYDNLEKVFFFSPGTGHNIVRVNGKVVMNAVQLNAFDKLTVGMTTLLFVPLCGDQFDWNEK